MKETMFDIEGHKELLRVRARDYLANGFDAFLKTYGKYYYFCKILSVEEEYIEIYIFAGPKQGENKKIYFVDIESLARYEPQAM